MTMDGAAGGSRAVAQQLTIVNRKGLHARASARFVRMGVESRCEYPKIG